MAIMSGVDVAAPGSNGLSRDLAAAKLAYEKKDVQMSILAHTGPLQANESHTLGTGKYVKSVLFGGLDGIITTFAIVSGVAGADLSWEVVLVLGLANLVADGISMGFGDYVSGKAELEYQLTELKRERWELDNCREGEIKEMIELYESRGIAPDDARLIIGTMSKYPDFFVNHMLVQELGIMPPDGEESPASDGLATFIAFLVFGSVPLLSFLLFVWLDLSANLTFALACILTALTLFFLGWVKGRITSTSPLFSGLSVLVNGVIAAGSAYLIGWGLSQAVDIGQHC